MIDTTLCYIEYNNCYLMLYRNKKENDQNQGKWIGVGGKVEPGETIEEGLLREVYEETGISLTNYKRRGVIDFYLEGWGEERMYLYSATVDSDFFEECNEGELKWIPKDEIMLLNLWEGDKIFLSDLINEKDHIDYILKYKGDELVECERKETF